MRTEGAIITNAGKDLLSYALANEKEIIFTKVKLGKGDVSSFDDVQKLEDIVSFYKEISINSILRNTNGIVRIRASFTNEEFQVDVVLKEVGVFAKVEGYKEILICYVNDGEGENFPSGSSGNIVEKVRDIYIGISTTTNVLAEIDKSNVYATIYDLEEEIEKCAKKVTKIIPGNGLQGGGTLRENVTLGVKSNDTSINIDQENGVTLKKTNSWLNDAAQLFTAKGALNLFNTLTTNFTNAINSAKEALRLEIVKKEDKFEKKSGFNLEKTDVPENNTNKLFSAKGALDLKNWIVSAYTNAINTTKSALESLIGNKLNHGGYGGTGQDLNNEISKKATKEQLGRMKVGRNLTVDEDGTVHGNPSYTHPTGNGNNHIPVNGASGNFLKWMSSGVAQWASIAWSDITGKPSSYPPSSHTHDDRYYTEKEVNDKINGRLPSNGKAVDSSKLNGVVNSTGATANTIAQRDSSADISARLFRSNYGNESRMTGAVAFRVNTSDNYIRFCSDPGAFRGWLNANHRGKADLLWSGGHWMDGGSVLSLNGKNFDQYQLIVLHVSCENNDDYARVNYSGQVICPTTVYGVASYNWLDLIDADWCGAYLINNYQIKPSAGSGVWIRRVYGIR